MQKYSIVLKLWLQVGTDLRVVALANVEHWLELAQEVVLKTLWGESQQTCVSMRVSILLGGRHIERLRR
jgi:N6-adenosine-specific RNA methylase IME4